MTVPNWALRALAALAVVAFASRADAQQPGKPKPPAVVVQPQAHPKPPAVIAYPQVNSHPGYPAWVFSQPAFNPGPLYNPALNNPYLNQTRIVPYNPIANNPFGPNPFVNPFVINPPPFGPVASSTPPLAFRQPGQLFYRGPDLQVNPTSGLVYKPLSGVARTADGSTFYYVPGSGLPTATGNYATGSGLYFDPEHNTFLNPATGVISRPGVTNIFVPWIQ